MDESGPESRFSDPTALRADPHETVSPGLRDAAEIVRLAAEDEVAATDARTRYRTEAPSRLEPDGPFAALLDQDEWLIAVRTSAVVDRRVPRPGEPARPGLDGQLAVTSRRLILTGRHVLTIELVEVEQIVLSGDRLLVVMHGGSGVALDVEQPRLLRVQIAAARAAARV